MLSLYFKPTCPFSQKVIAAAAERGIELDLRDISANPAFEAELLDIGGKHQTPFLVDDARNAFLYESDTIINHLTTHYAPVVAAEPAPSAPRVHFTNQACIACEG